MRQFGIAAACVVLTGCVSAVQNPQSPTPTEQLLKAHAAERAAAAENLRIAAGAKVFVLVAAGDDTPAGRYAAAAFRAHVAGRGAALVDDRAQADVVVELRISAAGIDDVDQVWGLPPLSIPSIPGHTNSTTTTPELSLYSRHLRSGVVEMSAVARDAKTGRLISAVGPLWAISTIRHHALLTGLVFGQFQEPPGLETKRSR